MPPLPPFAAVVLAGGRAARLGGQAKPQLRVGNRSMLDAVLAAVSDARERVVVGPPQPVEPGVVVLREDPPGGGPVAAMRAGLAAVPTEVVVVLAGDLPFLTGDVVAQLRNALADDSAADGVLVVDEAGRDQYLLGAWRTAALRAAVDRAPGHAPVRRALAALVVERLRPVVLPGLPPPWTDCDTPAELAAARTVALTLAGRSGDDGPTADE